MQSHKCVGVQVLSNGLAPPPSISCPRPMGLCRKPSPVPEMCSRCQKLALGTTYCINGLDLGIRMVSVSFCSGLLGALTWAIFCFVLFFVHSFCLVFCFCFSFVQGRNAVPTCQQPGYCEGMVGQGFLVFASALTIGECSFVPSPVGELSLNCTPNS